MKIRELLADKSKWTKEAFARDACGYVTGPIDLEARCWCLGGALIKCYGKEISEWRNIRGKILIETNGQDIASWNDNPNRKFEEVKQLIDKLDI